MIWKMERKFSKYNTDKVDMITAMENKIINFETEDLLRGIQNGVFDLADLCVLYEITKDTRIKML